MKLCGFYVINYNIKRIAKANADHRVIFLSILSSFPKREDISLYLIHSLEKLLIKETNEAALMKLLLVFVEHSFSAFSKKLLPYTKVLIEGIQNQKAPIRVHLAWLQ